MFNPNSACPLPAPGPTGTYIVQRQPDPVLEAALLRAADGRLEDIKHAAALLQHRRAERAAHALRCEEQRAALAYLNHAGTL